MTDPTTALVDLLVLLLAALVPALVWLIYARSSARYSREPWGTLLSGFAWGAIFATITAAIVESLLVYAGGAISGDVPGPEFTFLKTTSPWNLFFVVLVIAPFVEEGLKAAGTARSLGPLRVVADGPVVGASVGLGFGFFETFLYGVGAFLVGGLATGVALVFVRSISSVLLHGSSTAMFGYGYARGQVTRSSAPTAGYFLLAVGMHASYNLLASLGALLPLLGITLLSVDNASLVGLLLAIAFAVGAFQHVRTIIDQTDYPGASGVHPQFRAPPARRLR